MSKPKPKVTAVRPDKLFERIVSILEQARGNVVRAVNTNMVVAYWLIGREIVEEIQHGKGRAKYGEKVVEDLSARLTERYGQGFSVPNLKNFRQFYQVYAERYTIISYPVGSQSRSRQISRPPGVESDKGNTVHSDPGRDIASDRISCLVGTELVSTGKSYPAGNESLPVFSPQLSWSHYRALMRVESREAREFYEHEAVAGGWDKRTMERQIQSFYYERILAKVIRGGREKKRGRLAHLPQSDSSTRRARGGLRTLCRNFRGFRDEGSEIPV